MTPEQKAHEARLQQHVATARMLVEHYQTDGPREMVNDALDQLDDAERALRTWTRENQK